MQSLEDVATLTRIGVPARKVHHLGNGIDLGRFDPDAVDPELVATLRRELGAEPGDVVCGVVGRLVREKGYAEVFAAASALRDRLPNLRVVVVGPGDPEKADALTDAELDAARAAGVQFLGYREDVDDLYAAMDLYVLASHREGFPRSAMEAAAMGLPVVATDIRGCREVVGRWYDRAARPAARRPRPHRRHWAGRRRSRAARPPRCRRACQSRARLRPTAGDRPHAERLRPAAPGAPARTRARRPDGGRTRCTRDGCDAREPHPRGVPQLARRALPAATLRADRQVSSFVRDRRRRRAWCRRVRRRRRRREAALQVVHPSRRDRRGDRGGAPA